MASNSPFILPQYQGSMYDLQRRQALVQMLQQQSMESPASELPQGMAVQPRVLPGTMLGKIAQGLMGQKMGNQVGQDMNSLGQQQMNYLGPMMGGGQSPQPSAGAASDAGTGATPTSAVQPGPVGTGGMAPVSGAGPATSTGPLNPLHMDPRMAMMMYLSSPEEFMKTQSQAYTPTDAIKNNTWMGYTPDMARNAKIAEDMKNGEVQRTAGNQYVNYRTGVSGYTPKLPENAQINGVPAMNGSIPGGVSPVAGAQPIAKGNAYASGIGAAAAEPATAFDADGNPVPTNKAVMAGGGVPSAPVSGGKPLLPQAPLGAVENANTAAHSQQEELSKKWGDLNAQNAQAQPTISLLQNIRQLAPKAQTGQFSDRQQYVNSLLSTAGISDKATDEVTAKNLLDKYSNQITARLGQGGLGTDAARSIVQSAYPNSHMSTPAINEAVDNLVGATQMTQAKAKILQPHANARDPVAYNQKELVFDQNADPRIWQWKNISDPAQKKAFAKSVMQQDPNFPAKIKALEGIGAL